MLFKSAMKLRTSRIEARDRKCIFSEIFPSSKNLFSEVKVALSMGNV